MANFEPKTFNASDINGGQKFNAGDGITTDAINAPIESALLMQELATTQPQYIENGGSPSVTIENGQFVFANLKGEKGEQGEQGEQGSGGGGISFSYYSLKYYSDYMNGTMGCIPNLASIQKIEIDSYIVDAKQFTGSDLSSFVESFDSSIGNNNVLYDNGVKNNIDITLGGMTQTMYWDIGNKLIIPVTFNIDDYSAYNIYEIILKIYPKEA